jgi:hypothetical protein
MPQCVYYEHTTLRRNAENSLTYLLTYSTEQSPSWEANQFAANQEIPRILRNPKVHYCIHKCLPPVSILSQPNPVHNTTSHFLKIHLNIIFSSMPGSPQWSHSLRFPNQNPVHTFLLTHPHYMPHPSHSSRSAQYLVRSTDHKAPHYDVFSAPLVPCPS